MLIIATLCFDFSALLWLFYTLRDRTLPPRLNWILLSAGLWRGVRWFETDVSGLALKGDPIGSPETSVSNHLTPHNKPEDGRVYFYTLLAISLCFLLPLHHYTLLLSTWRLTSWRFLVEEFYFGTAVLNCAINVYTQFIRILPYCRFSCIVFDERLSRCQA